MAIEAHRYITALPPIEDCFPVQRVYGKTERLYLTHFLFHPQSIVKSAVEKAASMGNIPDDYMARCNYAEDMGTVFDFARCDVSNENPRGELFAEDINAADVNKMTGIPEERVVLLKDSLVNEGILRSKNQKPVQRGFAKR